MTPFPAPSTDDGLLSSAEVVDISGATYRQLDLWARNGMLEPAVVAYGSGSKRRYTYQQALFARVLERVSGLVAHSVHGPSEVLREVARGGPGSPGPWVVTDRNVRVTVERVGLDVVGEVVS